MRFRPAPYKDTDGKLIMPDAVEPGTMGGSDEAIASLDLQRTDSRVGNFFWVQPGSTMLDANDYVNRGALQEGRLIDRHHGNNRPRLYGLRRMQMRTNLLPNDIVVLPSQSQDLAAQQAAGQSAGLWHHQRAMELGAMNPDNSVLDDGSAQLRGSETLKPGRYLRIARGNLASEAHISRVAHQIAPLAGWTTNVTLERGTGYHGLSRNGAHLHLLRTAMDLRRAKPLPA